GSESKMPLTRRIGNTLFALLLGFLSKKKVRDTASGMRVIRAEALSKLLPLPDGLHFTPAMSARALMDDEVRIAEIDMRYHERIGASKLRVLRDGLRFLNVILSAAAYIRVSRLTIPIIATLNLAAGLIMLYPTGFYLASGRLEEWMFYRFAFAGMLGTIAVTALCATIVSEHVSALTLLRYERFGARARGLWRYENLRLLTVAAGALWMIGAFLNLRGVHELLTSGHVSLHWSRVMLGAFFSINLAQVVGTLCSVKIIRALHQRQPFIRPEAPTPRANR
ncbi:MAG TPA: glycosyltransferase family 2 protein, partial [Candidatus Polarisedimenticolia bacterium]|nr:glycosyltransferase family 2 protein [Candidatus Polarisedimenticolia bacterium]